MDLLVFLLVPLVVLVGAFATAIVGALARARVRELEIRERIAMIERGLVPSPEADPRKFDQFMARMDRYELHDRRPWSRRSAGRYRRSGLILVGVGVGLMLLIGMQSPREGLGVGGFVACLGLAFFLTSYFEGGAPDDRWHPQAGAGPTGADRPPSAPPPDSFRSGSSS